MKIGFTGTRYGLTARQVDVVIDLLSEFVHRPGTAEFHHGDCVGADATAAAHAWQLGYTLVAHPPNETTRLRAWAPAHVSFDGKPYLERDRNIVNQTEVLIAGPKGFETARSGTWYTIRYARTLFRPILLVMPSGELITEGPGIIS